MTNPKEEREMHFLKCHKLSEFFKSDLDLLIRDLNYIKVASGVINLDKSTFWAVEIEVVK